MKSILLVAILFAVVLITVEAAPWEEQAKKIGHTIIEEAQLEESVPGLKTFYNAVLEFAKGLDMPMNEQPDEIEIEIE